MAVWCESVPAKGCLRGSVTLENSKEKGGHNSSNLRVVVCLRLFFFLACCFFRKRDAVVSTRGYPKKDDGKQEYRERWCGWVCFHSFGLCTVRRGGNANVFVFCEPSLLNGICQRGSVSLVEQCNRTLLQTRCVVCACCAWGGFFCEFLFFFLSKLLSR